MARRSCYLACWRNHRSRFWCSSEAIWSRPDSEQRCDCLLGSWSRRKGTSHDGSLARRVSGWSLLELVLWFFTCGGRPKFGRRTSTQRHLGQKPLCGRTDGISRPCSVLCNMRSSGFCRWHLRKETVSDDGAPWKQYFSTLHIISSPSSLVSSSRSTTDFCSFRICWPVFGRRAASNRSCILRRFAL